MRSLLGEYLRARRALVRPEDVGLSPDPDRRVAGLRRDEVAQIAAISPEYYLRLEQGVHPTPSEPVLRGLARALLLDEAGDEYMRRLVAGVERDLADIAPATPSPEELEQLLVPWPHVPAAVVDRHMDVAAINRMMLVVTLRAVGVGDNVIRHIFSDEFRSFALGWERLATQVAAGLRFAGDPASPRYREIVDDLLARSADFRRIWARHDAFPWSAGHTTHDLPGFGAVEMTFQNLQIPGTGGHFLAIVTPEPGTAAAEAIAQIALAAQDPDFELPG